MSQTKTVLITGGSAGIGLATAEIFSKNGFDILITSLTLKELNIAIEQLTEKAEGVKIKSLVIDLSVSGNVQQMFDWAYGQAEKIDVVINNAGFGTFGFINDIDINREKAMINLMVNGIYESTRLFLAKMIIQNHGTIINISSVAAFQPNPTLSTYGACKSFVYSFTRSINEELKDQKSGVRCLTICPTPVKTNFQANANMQNSKLFDSWMAVDAEFVAKEIYNVFLSKKDYKVPGNFYHFINQLLSFFPDKIKIVLAKKYLAEK
jgi:uncharacterized protein